VTKILRLHAIGPWAGADNVDDVELPDDWDQLDEKEQENYIDQEARENFWNQGFEYYGKVVDHDEPE